MDTKQKLLYDKIQAFAFDEPGTARSFAARLAEERGWSHEHAARVIVEYRRFLFLAMAAGHTVCPAEDVDEAWHLHLIYSRSYWERLCGEVLGRPLHHDPSRGGGTEYAKHRRMYADTLASYRRLFGEEPPTLIWPNVDERFTPCPRPSIADTESYWLIRKPALWRRWKSRAGLWGAGVAMMAVAPLPLWGAGFDLFDLQGPEFLRFYAVLLLIAFGFAFATRFLAKYAEREPGISDTEPLDAYQAAYLSGGPKWAVKTAVAKLLADNDVAMVKPWSQRLGRTQSVMSDRHVLERALLNAMPDAPRGASWLELNRHCREPLESIAASLEARGLLLGSQRRLIASVVPLAVMALAIVIGAIKTGIGIERHRPVTYLVMMCVAAAVVTLAVFVWPVRRTYAGDRRLASMKMGHRHLRNEARLGPFSASDGLPLAVALYGLGVLSPGPLQHVARTIEPRGIPAQRKSGFRGDGGGVGCSAGISSCGGGGGCGGGGCGGGGCGGCGS